MDVVKISELLIRVPREPGTSLPGGVLDAELAAFSSRTRIAVPDELKVWLKLTNGPCIGPGGLFGIRTLRSSMDMESYLELYPAWKKKKWLPIAGDGCGNYYIMPTQYDYGRGFPVLFVETSISGDKPAYIVASDIEHFLMFLLEQELGSKAWPFDREAVTKKDPNILQFVGVPLPWLA
jgi:hypothetical protein